MSMPLPKQFINTLFHFHYIQYEVGSVPLVTGISNSKI